MFLARVRNTLYKSPHQLPQSLYTAISNDVPETKPQRPVWLFGPHPLCNPVEATIVPFSDLFSLLDINLLLKASFLIYLVLSCTHTSTSSIHNVILFSSLDLVLMLDISRSRSKYKLGQVQLIIQSYLSHMYTWLCCPSIFDGSTGVDCALHHAVWLSHCPVMRV
jgi:hypothetical protein